MNEYSEYRKKIFKRMEATRRESSSVTVKELADIIGITPSYLSAVINGRSKPSIDIISKYLIAGDFDLSPMMKLEVKSTQAKPHLKYRNKLVSLISDISDTNFQRALIEIIEALKKLENSKVK